MEEDISGKAALCGALLCCLFHLGKTSYLGVFKQIKGVFFYVTIGINRKNPRL